MATFSASQARDLVLNFYSEDGLLEDSSDKYILIFELLTGIHTCIWIYLDILGHLWTYFHDGISYKIKIKDCSYV